MTITIVPPTLNHLSRAYFELAQIGARAVGEKKTWPYPKQDHVGLLGLCAELSRYDPRLFAILVEYFHDHWTELSPMLLRAVLKTMVTPQTLLTILGFVDSVKDEEFHFFYNHVSGGFKPVAAQLYFKNLYAPASHNMTRAATESVQEFLDWGFLARERPIIHVQQQRCELGHWSVMARRNIVTRLLEKHGQISLATYLESVEHTVSRQQALHDLKNNPRLVSSGKGRGSTWVVR